MLTILLLFTFISIILGLIYYWKNSRYLKLGNKLPGPPTLPIIGNSLHFASCNSQELFKEIMKLLHIYGPIVRMWFGPELLIIVGDPSYVEEVVNENPIGCRGRYSKKLMDPVFGNGLLSIDLKSWRHHRKIVSSAFHINVLEKLVDNFAKNSSILAGKLKEISDGATAKDIFPYFSRCTFDIISETCFDYEMNAQINNYDELLNNVKTIINSTMIRCVKPWFVADCIFKLTKLGRKFYEAVKFVHDMINQVIERKETEVVKGNKVTLIDILLQSGELSKDEVVGEISSIGGAGAETTSTACCYLLALLGENQDIQDRIMKEQQEIFSDDILRAVTSEDLPKMTYLEQVLNEALRLFPPVPYHYREIRKEIDLGNGLLIPAGTSIMIVAYAIHRNPEYFTEPNRFDPERFSYENSVGRHPYAYIPFGIGRRMCVGHKFAIMEAKTILSTVLRRYRVTEIEGGISGLEKTLESGFVMTAAKGMRVKLVPQRDF